MYTKTSDKKYIAFDDDKNLSELNKNIITVSYKSEDNPMYSNKWNNNCELYNGSYYANNRDITYNRQCNTTNYNPHTNSYRDFYKDKYSNGYDPRYLNQRNNPRYKG